MPSATTTARMRATRWAIVLSRYSDRAADTLAGANGPRAPRIFLDPNSLAICRLPAPGAGAVTAPRHAFLVDLRNDLAVAGQQRFGRAHFGAQRQLAFGQPVGAVFRIF